MIGKFTVNIVLVLGGTQRNWYCAVLNHKFIHSGLIVRSLLRRN
jgi:hypothetical protein